MDRDKESENSTGVFYKVIIALSIALLLISALFIITL